MSNKKHPRIVEIDKQVANLEESIEKINFKIGAAVDLLNELEISAIKKLFNKVIKGETAPFAGEYLFYDGYSKIYLTETDWKEQNNNPVAWIDFRYECDWDKDYHDPNRYGWTLKFGSSGISYQGFDPRTKNKSEVERILRTHSAIGTLIELIADNKFDGIIDIRENYRVMRELETNNKDRKELSEAIHLLKTERALSIILESVRLSE